MNDPLADVKPPMELDTGGFESQQLKETIFWCNSRGDPHHWITSYPFINTVENQGLNYQGVSLDMYRPSSHKFDPSGSDLFGSLKFSVRRGGRLTSANPGFRVIVEFKATVTVKALTELIKSEGKQYYKFNKEGCGCMFWQLKLLEAFVTKGWITKTDLEGLKNSLKAYAKTKGSNAVPYPPVQGSFYTPTRT